MLFKDVIGHYELKKKLLGMVAQNRLSHALLFLGNEGSGALPLAMAFANFVILPKGNDSAPADLFGTSGDTAFTFPKTPEEADEWMQHQSGYQRVKEMIHPDLHYSYPVYKKEKVENPKSSDFASEWREFIKTKPYGNLYDWLQFINAETKQGNISVAECNDIFRKMNMKSFESGMKILIMWIPEALGLAGNKLLKLIEEPPPKTLFILVAENESRILQTILSRTQLIRVPPLLPQEIEQTLVSLGLTDASSAARIAHFSNGNFRQAIEHINQGGEEWEAYLREWLNCVYKLNTKKQIAWIDSISKIGREKQKQFLWYFIHILELAIRQELISSSPDLSERTDIELANRLNKICGISEKECILKEINDGIFYIERNANVKMLFHALSIKLYHIIKNKSLILT